MNNRLNVETAMGHYGIVMIIPDYSLVRLSGFTCEMELFLLKKKKKKILLAKGMKLSTNGLIFFFFFLVGDHGISTIMDNMKA